MNDPVFGSDRYAIDVVSGPSGFCLWIMRRDGKVLRRSAELFADNEQARADAYAVLDELLGAPNPESSEAHQAAAPKRSPHQR